jgi:hypothetical protein
MRNMAVCAPLWKVVALLLLVPGCTGISDCKYELDQKIRTANAWCAFDSGGCVTCDYKSGWKAGYYDVITGGTGCPPVVAPKKYWKPPVFFEHDPSRRNDWYIGFQDGAACAKCEPDHHYLAAFLPCQPTGPVIHHHHTPAVPPQQFPIEHLTPDTVPNEPMPLQTTEPAPMSPETEFKPKETPQPTPGSNPAYDQDPAPGDAVPENPAVPEEAPQALSFPFQSPVAAQDFSVESTFVERLVTNASSVRGH